MKNDGRVGIGTTEPNALTKLHVVGDSYFNGRIGCKEVEVTLASWPDYVFEEDYDMLPLSELEQYIQENKHLPEVPSAAEVIETGVNLGEMNALLIRKVEELTLYILDLQKQINELKQNNFTSSISNKKLPQRLCFRQFPRKRKGFYLAACANCAPTLNLTTFLAGTV
jgi:hypothetical protein